MKTILYTVLLTLVSLISNAQFEIIGEDNRNVCQKESFVLRATPGATSYKWYNLIDPNTTLSTTDSLVNSGDFALNANFIFCEAVLNGSNVSDDVLLFVNANPVITLSTVSPICEGDSIRVYDTESPSGFNYNWSNGDSLSFSYLKNNGSGNVTKADNIYNCSTNISYDLTVQEKPKVTLSGMNPICDGNTANLTATPPNGRTIQTNWYSETNTLLSSTNTLSYTPTSTETLRIELSETDQLTCTSSIEYNMTISPLINITSHIQDTSLCGKQTLDYSPPSFTGGTAPYTYSYYVNDKLVSNSEHLNYTFVQNSDVRFKINDKALCQDEITWDITFHNIEFDLTNTVHTCGENIVLEPENITSTSSNLIYEWVSPKGDTSNVQSIAIIDSGNYVLTISDEFFCSKTKSSFTTTTALTTAKPVMTDTSVCGPVELTYTAPTILTGQSPFSYQYVVNDVNIGNSETIKEIINETSNFKLTIKDNANCSLDFEWIVTYADINFSLPDSIYLCGNSDTLKANNLTATSEQLNYLWILPNGTTSSTEKIIVDSPGLYALTISDETGCDETQTAKVSASPSPKLEITTLEYPASVKDETSFSIVYILNDSLAETKYSTTGNGEIQEQNDGIIYNIAIEEEGDVFFTMNSTNECSKIDTTISVAIDYTKNENIWLPNSIILSSLNNEANKFKLYGGDFSEENFSTNILNERGHIIYTTTDVNEMLSNGWCPPNDILNALPSKVYTYIISGQFESGLTFDKTGTVTVFQ